MAVVLGVILRFIVGLVLAFTLLPACVLVCDWVIRHLPSWQPEDPLACAIGVVLGVVVIALWRPNWLWHTFVHESAHALACFALAVRVRSFKVTNGQGGMVEYDQADPFRATLIAIAPYTLPLIPLPFLIAQHLADESWRPWMSALASWAVVSHLHGLWHNLRLNFIAKDGDLAACGRLLGLVLIACALCLLAALCLAVLWHSRRIVPGWWL